MVKTVFEVPYPWGGLEPSVAQPPLPLQEFLPLQPLSLALHPPLPLQEFCPLQACFSFAWSWDWSCAEDRNPGRRFDAWMVALVPASKPARAALAISTFFLFVISFSLAPIQDFEIGHVFPPLESPTRVTRCKKRIRPIQRSKEDSPVPGISRKRMGL